MARNFYDILGVDRGASEREIKRAYTRRAKEVHPDRSDDSDATEKMIQVNKAYQVLSSAKERERYDRLGHEEYLARADFDLDEEAPAGGTSYRERREEDDASSTDDSSAGPGTAGGSGAGSWSSPSAGADSSAETDSRRPSQSDSSDRPPRTDSSDRSPRTDSSRTDSNRGGSSRSGGSSTGSTATGSAASGSGTAGASSSTGSGTGGGPYRTGGAGYTASDGSDYTSTGGADYTASGDASTASAGPTSSGSSYASGSAAGGREHPRGERRRGRGTAAGAGAPAGEGLVRGGYLYWRRLNGALDIPPGYVPVGLLALVVASVGAVALDRLERVAALGALSPVVTFTGLFAVAWIALWWWAWPRPERRQLDATEMTGVWWLAGANVVGAAGCLLLAAAGAPYVGVGYAVGTAALQWATFVVGAVATGGLLLTGAVAFTRRPLDDFAPVRTGAALWAVVQLAVVVHLAHEPGDAARRVLVVGEPHYPLVGPAVYGGVDVGLLGNFLASFLAGTGVLAGVVCLLVFFGGQLAADVRRGYSIQGNTWYALAVAPYAVVAAILLALGSDATRGILAGQGLATRVVLLGLVLWPPVVVVTYGWVRDKLEARSGYAT